MRKFAIPLLTLTTMFFWSCSHGNNSLDAEFSRLLSSFDLPIEEEEEMSYYVVIPAFSCSGCVQCTWDFLYENNIDNHFKLSIIDAFCNGKDQFMRPLNCNVIIDSCNIVESASIQFSNPTVIKVKAGKVQSLTSLEANRIEEMLNKLFPDSD